MVPKLINKTGLDERVPGSLAAILHQNTLVVKSFKCLETCMVMPVVSTAVWYVRKLLRLDSKLIRREKQKF